MDLFFEDQLCPTCGKCWEDCCRCGGDSGSTGVEEEGEGEEEYYVRVVSERGAPRLTNVYVPRPDQTQRSNAAAQEVAGVAHTVDGGQLELRRSKRIKKESEKGKGGRKVKRERMS